MCSCLTRLKKKVNGKGVIHQSFNHTIGNADSGVSGVVCFLKKRLWNKWTNRRLLQQRMLFRRIAPQTNSNWMTKGVGLQQRQDVLDGACRCYVFFLLFQCSRSNAEKDGFMFAEEREYWNAGIPCWWLVDIALWVSFALSLVAFLMPYGEPIRSPYTKSVGL